MIFPFISALLATLVLTGLVRYYALRQQVLDMPGERSSHTVPTPRGGGLSVVLLIPCLLAWLVFQQGYEGSVLLLLGSVTLLLALVGWVDDHRPLSARLRFSVQGLLALVALLLLPQLPSVPLPGWTLSAEWLLMPLLLLTLLWMTNLYNFMDGINGLATVEAVTVLLAGSGLLWVSGAEQYGLPLLLCAPLLGFLVWNFPRAKIFMGDVCSAPLGLLLTLLAFWLAAQTEVNLWCWLILLSVFVVDATWTLMVRLLTGQRWSEPHRSHGYQILSRRWGSHTPVTLAAGAVNLLWLLPLAWLAMRYPAAGLLIWLLAAAPLVAFCYRLQAGKPDA